jgi:6-phosphogluconolactonase
MNIYQPKITGFETLDIFYEQAESFVTNAIFDANSEFGEVRLCLAGGSTPIPLYQRLSKNNAIPWEKIELYQTDERYLDTDNKESNQLKIKQAFGEDVISITKSNFFNTRLPLKQAVKDYVEILETLDGVWFDLVVLGIGVDGHIASLFPNGSYFDLDYPVVETIAPDYIQTPQRISLTINSILNSKQILVLLAGVNKRQVLKDMLESDLGATKYPAKFLFAHPSVNIFQCLEN